MTFLARMKGPLGQRGEKSKPRSAGKTKAEKSHMANVASLTCIVCGAWPVEVHHEGKPRSNMSLLPLCPPHHRREFGPGAYHYSPSAFYAAHGSSEDLLKRVERMIADRDDQSLAAWF